MYRRVSPDSWPSDYCFSGFVLIPGNYYYQALSLDRFSRFMLVRIQRYTESELISAGELNASPAKDERAFRFSGVSLMMRFKLFAPFAKYSQMKTRLRVWMPLPLWQRGSGDSLWSTQSYGVILRTELQQ